ncbi:MAG: C25 family cysteine peptidase [candidate division WOR-3 bacterium]
MGRRCKISKYLIIVYDKFYDVIVPLAQWKYKKGLLIKVVKFSETGNNPEALKAFIINAYRFWDPRPEYVLLVGDINQIPPYNHYFCGPTDNPYGDVEGDAQLEIAIGRLPCRSRQQLKMMIDKIFSYERTPYLAETLWYRKAITVRQDPGPYHNAGVNFVRQIILNNSDFLQVDTLMAPVDSRRNLRDSLNQGRSYLLYTGHGAGQHWVAPFDMTPCVRNYRKLPIIFSWSCQTVLRQNFLGQRWLKTGNIRRQKGAVAYIGTTTSGLYAPYRNFVARNFFRAIFEHNVVNIGKALKEGLDSLWTYTPDELGRTLYSEWNLLGDPEMNLWTSVPKSMRIMYDSIISFNQQNFFVSATDENGAPIINAKVCLMMSQDSNFYYVGETDRFGNVSFNINPIVADTIFLTVTAKNFIPHEGKILVLPSSEQNFLPTRMAEPKRVIKKFTEKF